MLRNMLDDSKTLDEKMKKKYQAAILNGGSALSNHINFRELFEHSRMSEATRNAIASAVEFAIMKAKPLMMKYHQTLIQRSKEFAEM